MAADLILGLARASLAASVAIIAVLLLRKPARRLVGAQIAYGLWIAPLLAAVCSLTPAPAEVTLIGRLEGFGWPTVAPDQVKLLGGLWLSGFVVTLGLMTLAQARFARRMRRGTSGPALVGVLAPRIVAPRDFAQRFSQAERKVIRAHEQAHFDRQDSRANAVMALFQAVNWFNPLVHLAVRAARADQELACDAAVIARYPRERRRYAQALLSSQLGDEAAPLACHWPAPAVHPAGGTHQSAGRRDAGHQASGGWAGGIGRVCTRGELGRLGFADPCPGATALRLPHGQDRDLRRHGAGRLESRRGKLGRPGGDRTLDHSIKSRMLYR
jgi:hypothetical protein